MDIRSLRIMQAFFMLLLHTSSPVVAADGEFHGASVMCKEKERQALLSLKHDFLDAWDVLSSWTSEENNTECCRWEGVGCNNRTGHVVKLDLHEVDPLGGIINPSLLELHHLTYLDLSMNFFDHINVPKFIGSLTHLKYLSLHHAMFKGKIPHELGNLSHLEYLDLSDNSFDGEFPTHLCNLSRLVHLDLGRNNITGEVPYNLGNLSHLQYLDLSGNYYYDYEDLHVVPIQSLRSDLQWVSHLKSLKTLTLHYVDLSSAYNWLEQVANLPYLQELNLEYSNLHDSITSTFSSVKIISTNLSSVELSHNNLTSSIHKSFLDVCSLRELYLSSNELCGRLDEFIPTSRNCAKYDLEVLDLSWNKLTGSVPNLSQFPSLRSVLFDFNRLNGSVSESVGELSKLDTFSAASNSLQGVISEVHFSKLSELTVLDLSFNALMVDVSSDWVPPFQIQELYLASCKLGPHFPRWLQTQKVIAKLDISSNSISDLIPDWLWDIFSNMQMLNLSHNQISGEIANLALKDGYFGEIDLSFNLLRGQIPSFLSMTSGLLDLSNNIFLDANLFICPNETKYLSFLDLSNNQLMGKLPECWRYFKNLVFLSLANNSLSGNIPSSMGFLTQVKALHLGNNNFTGEIPLSLNNCSQLRTLDMVQNKLSGPVPNWIGDGFQKLQILSLRSNKFHGCLPFNICHLSELQVLDLASNNISGSIPDCLHELTTLVRHANLNKTITYNYFDINQAFPGLTGYNDHASFIWKGKEEKYSNTLGLVKSIDLSSNNFIGKIPSELMNLTGLVSLNISRNKLSGKIPSTIRQLKSLDSLDLSRNQLYGKIPSQFSELGFLGVLDLSYNNLSGEIPYVTKLLSFDASAYMGNPELCGAPLPKCLMNQTDRHDVNVQGEKHHIISGFYISMIIGFIVGFWGICGSLVVKKSWRYAYFKFFDDLYDKLYVSSVISMAKLRRRMRNMS